MPLIAWIALIDCLLLNLGGWVVYVGLFLFLRFGVLVEVCCFGYVSPCGVLVWLFLFVCFLVLCWLFISHGGFLVLVVLTDVTVTNRSDWLYACVLGLVLDCCFLCVSDFWFDRFACYFDFVGWFIWVSVLLTGFFV